MVWIDPEINIRAVVREARRRVHAVDRTTSEFPDRVVQTSLQASTTVHGLSEAVHRNHGEAAENAARAVTATAFYTLLVFWIINAAFDYRLPITVYPVLLMATSGWWSYVSTVISNRPSLVEPVSDRASEETLAAPRPPASGRNTVIEGTLTRVGRMVGAVGTMLLLLVSIAPAILPNLAGLLPEAVPPLPVLLDLALAGIVILAGLTVSFRFLAQIIAELLALTAGILTASVVARCVFPEVAWLVPTAGLLLITTGSALRMLYSAYVSVGQLRHWVARAAPVDRPNGSH